MCSYAKSAVIYNTGGNWDGANALFLRFDGANDLFFTIAKIVKKIKKSVGIVGERAPSVQNRIIYSTCALAVGGANALFLNLFLQHFRRAVETHIAV